MAIFRESSEGIKDIEFSSGARLAYSDPEVEEVLKDRRILHTIEKLIKSLNMAMDDKLEIEEDGVKVISEPGLNVRKSRTKI